MLMAIAGAFDEAAVVDQVDALLGDWAPAPLPTFEPAPGPQAAARCHVEHRDIEQGHLCLALPALESVRPFTALASKAAAAPRRMAFMYFPNGALHGNWWPTGD